MTPISIKGGPRPRPGGTGKAGPVVNSFYNTRSDVNAHASQCLEGAIRADVATMSEGDGHGKVAPSLLKSSRVLMTRVESNSLPDLGIVR